MIFLDVSPLLIIEDIEEVESQLTITFPEEFKEHYLKYNGGFPEGNK